MKFFSIFISCSFVLIGCDRNHNCQCVETDIEKIPTEYTTVTTNNYSHKGSETHGKEICDGMNYYYDDEFGTRIVECEFQK